MQLNTKQYIIQMLLYLIFAPIDLHGTVLVFFLSTQN